MYYVSDLSSALKNEKIENERLEGEMKEWISHGVSAEFDKKNKVLYIQMIKLYFNFPLYFIFEQLCS